MEIYYL